LPLDRCNSVLLPFSAVGYHPHVNTAAEIVIGSSYVYVMHRAAADVSSGFTEDLHSYVRRKRRLSEREAARLFAQALHAVAHCHRRSVVVRDVKLRRFLFANDDRSAVGRCCCPSQWRRIHRTRVHLPSPHFYKWLGTGGIKSRTAKRKLTKLCLPS